MKRPKTNILQEVVWTLVKHLIFVTLAPYHLVLHLRQLIRGKPVIWFESADALESCTYKQLCGGNGASKATQGAIGRGREDVGAMKSMVGLVQVLERENKMVDRGGSKGSVVVATTLLVSLISSLDYGYLVSNHH